MFGFAVGRGRDEPEIDAAQQQHVLFFLALRLGHDNDGAVAACVADQREADAGIAGGAFDDDAAWLQQAALLGVLDDVERGAILDRTAGVEELGLAKDRAASRLGGAAQLDQGGIADCADKTVADVHCLASVRAPLRMLGERLAAGDGGGNSLLILILSVEGRKASAVGWLFRDPRPAADLPDRLHRL